MAKFKLNRAGVRILLKSEEMADICQSYANKIQRRCGDGYEVTVYTGKNRVNASVHAATVKARKDNSKNNTLLKAMRG
jgi:hypothetical protein|nr:MAG TPA: type I neck protein [Caudoviricetes sp.]